MRFVVRYAERAVRDLRRLDDTIAHRIVRKLRQYRLSENPLIHAQRLAGTHSGLYRFRVGDYRVVFTVTREGELTILFVLHLAHRKEVYLFNQHP
ncbi:MAG: type II toxin-antitoxin system RelE/ParE family toxin [Candidatus Magasanikbacteria bacterium]|nr:type II toxin-antitoxin system RelE/ParE family toxin [Candidatus Magasanikbacteria bacterium]